MFRLQGCFEDDTIYLFRIIVHLQMYAGRSCWRRGGFSLYLKKTKYLKEYIFGIYSKPFLLAQGRFFIIFKEN